MVDIYGTKSYAETLDHIGTVEWMPTARGSMLRRPIRASRYVDLVAPYPWAGFSAWQNLGTDLHAVTGPDGPVSATAVISPSSNADDASLAAAFPDHLVDFKPHYLVDLTGDHESRFGRAHRRTLRRLDPRLTVREEPTSAHAADTWVELYARLANRHQLSDNARFSGAALRAQFAAPCSIAFSAVCEHETVGMVVFVVDGDRAAYHLGAYSDLGYELESSYAIFPVAFRALAERGVSEVNLGGGAGLEVASQDGLSRFKRGWASHSAMSRIGGRILRPDVYDDLSGSVRSLDHFPAYRSN